MDTPPGATTLAQITAGSRITRSQQISLLPIRTWHFAGPAVLERIRMKAATRHVHKTILFTTSA